MLKRVPEDTVQSALRTAILETFRADRVLFDDRTNERSILFHIARRLVPIVSKWGERWSVDLEYNRWHEHELEMVRTKVLQLSPDSPPTAVYPDLIVHDRSASSYDCNLLVMEAKHAPRKADRISDYRKLLAYLGDFGYQHAVFLEFPACGTGPRWCWGPQDAWWDERFDGPEWRTHPVA